MLFTISRREEIPGYFGIKGPAVSLAIKVEDGRLDGKRRLTKEIEYLTGKMLTESGDLTPSRLHFF
jgi:hypothetical protein